MSFSAALSTTPRLLGDEILDRLSNLELICMQTCLDDQRELVAFHEQLQIVIVKNGSESYHTVIRTKILSFCHH